MTKGDRFKSSVCVLGTIGLIITGYVSGNKGSYLLALFAALASVYVIHFAKKK